VTQAEAIEIMKSGANVFLTGPPGAGKTYTLYKLIEWAEEQGKILARTASTGIAASHINGVTIHSWSGLGVMEQLSKQDMDRLLRNSRVTARYKEADILIIDEISMLHDYRLDMVNLMAQKIRKNALPFGGLQIIMVGDLFQLPPVNRESTELRFVYMATSWRKAGLKVCYITEQHRQEGDDPLLDLLIAMRTNTVTDIHRQLLKNRIGTGGDRLTKLYTHNVDVDRINQIKIDAIPKKSRWFKMTTEGDPYQVQTMKRNILAPEELELKEGAEVMFVANDFKAGFVNGTRGQIVKFTKNAGLPRVRLEDGRVLTVDPHDWNMKENDRTIATVTQMPLRLAWAITVHKSQGMTLDAAEIDLSKAFTTGMGYVALSRVRSMKGLYLMGMNEMALQMHADIYEFDEVLRAASEANRGQE
jgi:ATP-dependent DNA helicase PIF1